MPRKFKCALCKYRKCFDSVNSIEISIEAVNICRYKCLFAYMRHVLFCWLSIGTFSVSFLNNLPGLNVSFFMFDALLDYFDFFNGSFFYRHAQPISSFRSYLPTYIPNALILRSSSVLFNVFFNSMSLLLFHLRVYGVVFVFLFGACIPKLLLNFNAMWSIVMILTENCSETPWSIYIELERFENWIRHR